jgi:soluble P-type ATPase
MTLTLDIPGLARLELDVLLLDVNGTLTDRGLLIDEVAARISALRSTLAIELLSADTYGTLDEVARLLGVRHRRAATAQEKAVALDALGASRSVAVGNGANDAEMLAAAALGIAVIGPEGASARALAAADVVCRSITEALDLLADPRALTATLRR